MQTIENNLDWLSSFFQSLCNGDWEHGIGCQIETLDNPGWHFKFDLSDTIFEDIVFTPIVDLRTDMDWINCGKDGPKFSAVGGPGNLDELIGVFRTWIEGTHL